MDEALQHGSREREVNASAPGAFDLVRILLLLTALLLIAFRCYKQYPVYRQALSPSVLHLHLRSLDGFRFGMPIYLKDHLSAKPKWFLVIPVQSTELLAQRRLWNTSAAAVKAAGMFPILVCVNSSCPLSDGEAPSQTKEVVVIDRLQYIPALSVAQAAERHHALVVNTSMIVTDEIARPESMADISVDLAR